MEPKDKTNIKQIAYGIFNPSNIKKKHIKSRIFYHSQLKGRALYDIGSHTDVKQL